MTAACSCWTPPSGRTCSAPSILFPGVVVEAGAVVRNCVLFKEDIIRRNAQLAYIIADKDVEVLADRTLMGHATYPIVLAKGSVV